MKKLKPLLLNSLLLIGLSNGAWGLTQPMTGGGFEISKDLLGASGAIDLQGSGFALIFSFGESMAGNTATDPTYMLISGYLGDSFGNTSGFHVDSARAGASNVKTFFQDRLQVGASFNAPVELTFSDPVDAASAASSIHAVVAADHLGNTSGTPWGVDVVLSSSQTVVTLTPQVPWTGNTLINIHVDPTLTNVYGIAMGQPYDLYFLTTLDRQEDNVVQNPFSAPSLPAGLVTTTADPMSIQIPASALPRHSVILASRDPLLTPLQIDPAIISEANTKARSSGGDYRVPLAIQEITAYDIVGSSMAALSIPAQLTIHYGTAARAPAAVAGLIRPQTLSLYRLDETHRLWVKIPASQNSSGAQTVSAPLNQMGVYALMGSPDGSAADTFAFPVPWRPHGPNAGTGSGQTGTEAGGITFSNLPSECTIKIYTVAGDLVRQLNHSDLVGAMGQETWDVKTTHGDSVASGVYLWRVQSSVDSKNGKLMVIR